MNNVDAILQIERRLINSLTSLCESLGIKLNYYDELEDNDSGQLYYDVEVVSEKFDFSNTVINIANNFKGISSVLGHELGHYMAINKHQDLSEEAADREALKLCKLILTDEEFEIMDLVLRWHFIKGYGKLLDNDDKDEEKLLNFLEYLKWRGGDKWEHFSSSLGV